MEEKWFYNGAETDVVNSYKYCACEDYACNAKGKILDLMRTMWILGNLDTTVFFQLFDAQVKPMLLCASEIWGMTRLSKIEKVHPFACKRSLSVNETTPNHMVSQSVSWCF